MSKIRKFVKKSTDSQSLAPEKEQRLQQNGNNSYGKRLRLRAEEYQRANPAKIDNRFQQSDTDELVHELSTYQIELELQNEELRTAQLELEKSRQRLSDMYDFAPVGYLTFDPRGIITSVNQTAANMLETAKTKLVRVPFTNFVHHEDTDRFHIYHRKTIREGEKQTGEFRLKKKTGEQLHVQIESIPVQGDNGTVSEVRTTLSDISQRIQTERKLSEQEEKFRLIADNSIDIIFQLDPEGLITYVSPAVRTLGYNQEDVLGSSLSRFIAENDMSRAYKAFHEVFRDKGIKLMELEVIRSDGSAIICEVSATPVKNKNVITGVQGIARDITGRKQMENALRKNEAKLQTILDNLTEGVVVSDLDGKLIYWNQAAVKMHGFASEDEYQRNLHEFKDMFALSTPEEGILPLEKWPMSRILRGETLKRTSMKVWRRDIDMGFFINYSGSLVRDRNNNPLMAVLTISDVTDHKLAEEKLHRSNRLLQGIREIFEAGLRCESDKELAAESLRVVERVTKSCFGFIGEIGQDGLLHDIAINTPGGEECTMDDRTGHRSTPGNLKIDALYGQVLSTGAPFFTNKPSSHQAIIGTPDGHPLVENFLGVPITYAGKTIGIFALANRKGGYVNDDVESVRALTDAFTEILFKCRMEKALAQSEVRERTNAVLFKQFFDFTPIPVWIAHDPEGKIVTSNRAAAKLLGVEPDRNISLASGPDLEKPAIKVLRDGRELLMADMPLQYAVRNAIAVDDVEMEIITSDNKTIKMIGAATPLYDARGKVSGGIGAFVDITEHKWLEEQLLQAKREWEKTFDAVPDLIAILDTKNRIVRANRAMAEKLGLTPGQCIGKYCFSCIHDEFHPIENCPNILTLRDGREHTAIVHEETLGGYYLVTTTPFLSEEGEILATVHVARDITELKEAEKLLQESQRHLLEAQKIAHLGSWELDTINNELTWSDEVYRIFGIEPQSFEPCYEDFLEMVHPEDRQKVHETYFKSIVQGKNGYQLDHRIMRKGSGEIRYLHEKCVHLRDKYGTVIRSTGMVHDITERKMTEEQIHLLNMNLEEHINELRDINREYERSNKDLQQYAYIISHDLQEPLRSVSSFVQLLSRRYKGKLDDKADTFIDFALEGTAHMQKMLKDLLEYSRVGGGGVHLNPISLESVVEKCLANLSEAIAENQAEIEFDPLPVVNADEMLLTQLFQNLINNALKFRNEKKPHIRISAENRNDEWIISVRDNGIGIDPRFRDRIFLLFQRLHGKDEYSGTGLGLALCKKVVEQHGGRIWVESEPDKGATFYFTFPKGDEE